MRLILCRYGDSCKISRAFAYEMSTAVAAVSAGCSPLSRILHSLLVLLFSVPEICKIPKYGCKCAYGRIRAPTPEGPIFIYTKLISVRIVDRFSEQNNLVKTLLIHSAVEDLDKSGQGLWKSRRKNYS